MPYLQMTRQLIDSAPFFLSTFLTFNLFFVMYSYYVTYVEE